MPTLKAYELKKYMDDNHLDRIVVDVIDNVVPPIPGLNQGQRTLANRLLITNEYINARDRSIFISYLMYNSFKKSKCHVPFDFEFIVCSQQQTEKVLAEYDEQVGGLEQLFRDTYQVVNAQIQEKLSQATELINQAQNLSEQNGVPFNAGGLPSVISYIPDSLQEKFGELDRGTINDISDTYGEYAGWQTSSSDC